MGSEAEAAMEISDGCRPLLAGHPPHVQGAALADLLAIWLAGHPKVLRETLVVQHLDHVRQLVVVNEKLLGLTDEMTGAAR